MLVVGLTGGIGSGKSVVTAYFAELGVPIIDADQVARDVVEPGKPAYQAILQHFGRTVLENTGHIDRTHLRHLIFSKPNERAWLENLLHPLILTDLQAKISALAAPYCIVAIPLLVETLPHPYLDRILVIDADVMDQIARTASRDQLPLEKVEAILNAQATREQRLHVANDIILNNSTLAALKAKVQSLHQTYLRLSNNSVQDQNKS